MWLLFPFKLFFNNVSRKDISLLKLCSTNFYKRGLIEFKNTFSQESKSSSANAIVWESGVFFAPPLLASGDLATRVRTTPSTF